MVNLFNLFKPKKSIDQLLLEALNVFGEEYDPVYDSYFQSPGENPQHAKLAWALSYLIEEENPHQKRITTQSFLNNFYSFLEKKARKIQDPGSFLRFLGLTYRIYENLVKQSGQCDFSPSTPTCSLDLDASEMVLLNKHIKKTTLFNSSIDSYPFEKSLRKNISYLIEVYASSHSCAGL